MKINRRKFLKLSGIAGAFAATTGIYAVKIEPYWLKTKTYDLKSAKWPKDMPPLRIALAADMHVGCPSVNLERLKTIVDDINALNPDIIVMPGDFLIVTDPTGDIKRGTYVPPAPIAEILKKLKAPLGVYASLGNHDWNCDGPGLTEAFENVGIRVLENHALRIKSPKHNFWIAGLADDSTRTPDWQKTAARITDDTPVILLSHDPATFLEKHERPVVTLSGHTHGGQVDLGVVSGEAGGRTPARYKYGHIVEENCDLIITSGIGTSRLPLRIGARPEIVSIKIGPT